MSRTFILVPVFASACLLGVTHVGSGESATETMELSGFDTVHNTMSIEVSVQVATESSIELTCDDNLFDEIIVDVEDGELSFRTERGHRIAPRTDCFAVVSLPSLVEVSSSGTGLLRVDGDAPELAEAHSSGTGGVVVEGHAGALSTVRSSGTGGIEIVSAGAGDCALELDNSGTGGISVGAFDGCELSIDNSGTGQISVVGQVDALSMRLSGTGGMHEAGLVAREAEIRISGTGGAELTVAGSLVARLSGTGSLIVHGDPEERDVSESGTGRVRYD